MSNSYKPDFMLIKLNNDFSELHTEGIHNRFLFGVFFHEWIHYFHNVSTNFGMSTFTLTASLWLYFHNVNKNGEMLEHSKYKDNIKMLNSLLAHSREQVNPQEIRTLINKNTFEDLEIIKVNLKKIKISEKTHLHSLVCDIKLKNKNECIGSVEIRPIEIFENLAYLLEKKLVESLQKNDNSESKFDTFDAPLIIPYRMVELLLNYYIQDLSEDDCIRIMLVSLQVMDSIELLNEIIKIVNCKEKNISIEKCLTDISEKILIHYNIIEELDKSEEWINESFPVNDVIGKAIKSLFKIIKKNLKIRYKNPFIEFDIINLLEKNLKNFDEILKEYSCCALLIPLSRASIKDELVKSQLVVIGLSDSLEDWQQFHAAFHFIGLHIKNDKDGGFKDTTALKNSCCPFFNVCDAEPKQKNISLCQNTPWKNYNANNPTVDVCWYANGVRQTIYCPD